MAFVTTKLVLLVLTMAHHAKAFVAHRSLRIRRLGRIPARLKSSLDESSSTSSLDWETFEFSSRPKWVDHDAQTKVMQYSGDLDVIAKAESLEDQVAAQRINSKAQALESLAPDVVERATAALVPFVNSDRLDKIQSVLDKRTRHSRFLFENPSNPSNVWACLRTIDSFGVQNVDIVMNSRLYEGRSALAQKTGMRTAMGSAQWLTLHNHRSTKDAIQNIRNEGYRVYASDLNPHSRDIRDIDWNQISDQPICIVMGNEATGISQEMRDLADGTFTLPMCGFAESFNLSVATAITLAHLSACSKNEGPLRPGLPPEESNRLLLKGILNSIQKRTAKALLKREGIMLPSELL